MQLLVAFLDDNGHSEVLGSEASDPVAAALNNPATGAPAISGTAQVGQTLTASTSDIADDDGLTGVSYSYQWLAGRSDIDGATGSSYLLTSGDQQGQTLQVKVSFTDDNGDNEETRTSEASDPVAAALNKPATGAPAISGTPQVGETLTASTSDIADQDGLTGVSYSYQWIVNDGSGGRRHRRCHGLDLSPLRSATWARPSGCG